MPYKNPEARRAYQKEYREKNKEKIKAQVKAWYERNKERSNAKKKAWTEKNKERARATKKAWTERNRERSKAAQRAWAERNPEYKKTWNEDNKERRAKVKKEWRKNNKSRINVTNANRRALKFRATIRLTELDKFVIDEMYSLAKIRTEQTEFQWHVDHIVPLTKGGLHKPTNLQVVPGSWNITKGNRTEDKWQI